jgi:hypothetical protein
MQNLTAGQETPSSEGWPTGSVPPLGSGRFWTCQDAPFHRSARMPVAPDARVLTPTAVQALADEHEMPFSCPPGTVPFDEDTIFQAAGPAASAGAADPNAANASKLAARAIRRRPTR